MLVVTFTVPAGRTLLETTSLAAVDCELVVLVASLQMFGLALLFLEMILSGRICFRGKYLS